MKIDVTKEKVIKATKFVVTEVSAYGVTTIISDVVDAAAPKELKLVGKGVRSLGKLIIDRIVAERCGALVDEVESKVTELVKEVKTKKETEQIEEKKEK